MTVLLNVHKKLTFNQLKFICTVDIKRFHHHTIFKSYVLIFLYCYYINHLLNDFLAINLNREISNFVDFSILYHNIKLEKFIFFNLKHPSLFSLSLCAFIKTMYK